RLGAGTFNLLQRWLVKGVTMSEALTVLMVLVMIIAPCALVVASGLWIKRRTAARQPRSLLVSKLTPTGIALYAGLVLFLLGGTAVRQLAPESEIGSFLATPTHALMALLALWVLFNSVSVIASKLGHPISPKRERNESES
ncbi:hypothetical protein DVT68_19860, partial [Dyella solisilvae]